MDHSRRTRPQDLDRTAVLAAFDRQVRRDARPEGPGARIERDGRVVRHVGDADTWNGVLWSDLGGLDGPAVDAVIAAQRDRFAALGLECEWKLYEHDRPADLGSRLRAAGFVPEPTETLMVAECAALTGAFDAAGAPGPALPEGLRLLPVTDAAGVELLVRVHEAAFGPDRSRVGERLAARLASAPETVAASVVLAGDTPVSAARLELRPGTDFAGLWGGGTVPEWRGRGLYRALVGHRARIASARGFRHLQVDASELSRPILERLGFVALTTTTPFVRTP
ncbi:GNAT family N-acetyltransferase [Streptomyces sp. NPDC093085]|uniref:GNAT family N-acetyltransferase n=1 Tax=Streptomyces sp. NPDC093085 TaxID=3155068 RepID=UPI003429F0BA